MPSVEQMVNEIQTILAQVEVNTNATAQQTGKVREDADAIKTSVAALLSTTEDGFTNLSQGLATIVDREDETNSLLSINDAQNKVIICWLSTIAEMACQQLHRLDRQIELQESIERSAHRTLQITELVHAREALEVKRQHELIERIEDCCPPKRPEPKPCFKPCEEKRPSVHTRQIASFEPLPPQQG